MRVRRPVWLWIVILWMLGTGIVSAWRGIVLWDERQILYERGSSLSPPALAAFALIYVLCGLGLVASGAGLWWQGDWVRRLARACLVVYLAAAQVYLWLFVRTGLMWQRRWVSLAGAVLGAGIGVGVLTWPRSRKWMGLG